MGAGAQVVFVGASGREESVKDVAGVRPNSSNGLSTGTVSYCNQ